jgi:fermentation-respiration switch protein FrsA (DUF1100 family)
MGRWMIWLGAAVAAYALVIGLLYVGQRRMMYLPDGVRPDAAAAGVPELAAVTLTTADGLALLAWYRPPASDGPTLVYFHGNAGNLGDRAVKLRPYLDAGLGILLPAYRGYSGNAGSPSEAGLYADGRAALDFLAARGVAAASVVLYGESLGGGVAVQLATERAVGGVVLEAPFTSMAAAAQYHYPWTPARWLVRDRFDNLAKIARIHAPVLILHGEADGVVPVAMSRRLLAAANEPKAATFLPAAGHNDAHLHGLAAAVLSFISTQTSANNSN